jgi:lipoic acid synthetase
MVGVSAMIDRAAGGPASGRRHPDWLKVPVPAGEAVRDLRRLVRGLHLNTVCEEARCPNLGECWDERTATIMILGETCTRACGFCAVRTGRPTWFDADEPRRVAEAVAALDLDHVVITSVARDDLPDGGASIFAETIRRVRAACPGTGIEVLISDFNGEEPPLRAVVEAAPDILDHNLETVERLQLPVRRRARYGRSLGVLARAKSLARGAGIELRTKSSLMVGLGETEDEVLAAFRDLRAVDCDVVTIGQYLRPTRANLPVVRHCSPAEFARLREAALALGFGHVESGPLVRTSYHARGQVPGAELRVARRRAALDPDGRVVPGSLA